ncbi:MAG: hypothetical protein ACP5I4_14145 [Oceanipulchritudo sp.]
MDRIPQRGRLPKFEGWRVSLNEWEATILVYLQALNGLSERSGVMPRALFPIVSQANLTPDHE